MNTKELCLVVLFCATQLSGIFSYKQKRPLVETNYGTVRGTLELSRSKREYQSFKGIPYAKPPIGPLRFKAPEPPVPWGTTFGLDASVDAPYCIQKNDLFGNKNVEGQEDCLYLNVYVPEKDPQELLPVMVLIHWGGFFAGRGSSDYIGPEYFMDRNVILVSFNYRLGVLGFLSTLDDEAPGNYALKDQVMALKFVRDNIGSFGGDKNRVTIFGESAGGGSVSLHLVSPASKGLFQQAISQSGAVLDLWATPNNDVHKQVLPVQASLVGCEGQVGNNSALIECLRNVKAEDLVASVDKFRYFFTEPLALYPLVIEDKTEANPDPFLTKYPVQHILTGDLQKVPWMTGVVQNEGILRAGPLIRQSKIRQTLNENFSTYLPKMLYLDLSAGNQSSNVYKNMVDFYMGGEEKIDINNPNSVQGFIDIYTDRSFFYGFYQTVALQSKLGHTPIWVYNFDYRGKYTYGDLFSGTNETIDFPWGVCHSDDLLYLFRSPALFPDLETGPDTVMSDNMVTIWTNFAIFGNPDPNVELGWNALTFANTSAIQIEDFHYLNVTGSYLENKIHFSVENRLYKDRLKFWASQPLLENIPGLI